MRLDLTGLYSALLPEIPPKPYESQVDIVIAMKDSRYGSDPQYTREVERRMKATHRRDKARKDPLEEARNAAVRNAKPFTSREELVSAVSDPRYGNPQLPTYDPHFTAQTQARLMASDAKVSESSSVPVPVSVSEESPKPFRSAEDRTNAYADSRYSTSEDYRAEVAAREAASLNTTTSEEA